MSKKKNGEQPESVCEEPELTDAPEQNIEIQPDETEVLRGQLLRLAAEYDNFRKRAAKEKDATYADAQSALLKQLLPAFDAYELSQGAPAGSIDDYKKGVGMIFDKLFTAFKNFGIEAFGSVGDEFDPELHNAVMNEENAEISPGHLTKVLQSGYKCGERVIRPAMVAVAS